MSENKIIIDVRLDPNKIPEAISWNASGSSADRDQAAKAFMLSFWDGAEKTALRMDLWTKDMMVDEMADFMFQTVMTMADTFQRATGHEDLTTELKKAARTFYRNFQDKQQQQTNNP
jgi:gliding motility-associated protein GldC